MPTTEQVFEEIVKKHAAIIKQVDEENLVVKQRSQMIRIKINPNSIRSQTNNY